MKVSEVMTPFAESVHPDDPLRHAFERMKALDLDPMPVTESDRLVGILTSAEVMDRAAESGLSTATVPVREVMSGLTTCIRSDDDVDDALRTMESGNASKGFAKLPVVDADGTLVGTVAREALRRGHEEEQVTSGTAAVFDVESISSIADIVDDPVEFMDDESFPASDPLPPPGAFGPDEQD
jgi:CBS domain-containing protein